MNQTPLIRPILLALACAIALSVVRANESFAEIKKAAENGSAEAQNKIGQAYLRGKEVPADAAEAFKWFKKSAEQANDDSQYWVGSLQTRGNGTLKNPEEGLNWILKAANQDHGEAQLFLGMKYSGGEEAFEHHKEAFVWLKQAADHRIPTAYFHLGSLYLSGIDGDRNVTEAMKWLKMAADECQPNAQFTLGILYIGGEDSVNYFGDLRVDQDIDLGCMYLNLAKASGDLCEDSEGAWSKLDKLSKTVPPEQFKAASIKAGNWAKDAADRGNPLAQYEVGMMYYGGFCLPEDLPRAHLYGTLALESGKAPVAKYFISDVKKKMSHEQLEESRRLLNDWRAAHSNKQ